MRVWVKGSLEKITYWSGRTCSAQVLRKSVLARVRFAQLTKKARLVAGWMGKDDDSNESVF